MPQSANANANMPAGFHYGAQDSTQPHYVPHQAYPTMAQQHVVSPAYLYNSSQHVPSNGPVPHPSQFNVNHAATYPLPNGPVASPVQPMFHPAFHHTLSYGQPSALPPMPMPMPMSPPRPSKSSRRRNRRRRSSATLHDDDSSDSDDMPSDYEQMARRKSRDKANDVENLYKRPTLTDSIIKAGEVIKDSFSRR